MPRFEQGIYAAISGDIDYFTKYNHSGNGLKNANWSILEMSREPRSECNGYTVYEVKNEDGDTIHYELCDPNGNQINGPFQSIDSALEQIPRSPRFTPSGPGM